MRAFDDLGPLPTSDANSALQRESLAALHSLLPPDSWILRDERVDDLGVDASLEVLASGQGTNFRAQIQLKARRRLEPNHDNAISVAVETANINYLLNGVSPLYILYRPENRELRYAFAREELHRIESTTPNWRSQQHISIRFAHLLDQSSLNLIRTRIMTESRINRSIQDKIAPVRGMVWGAEKIRDWLNGVLLDRLAASDPDDVQPPAIHIAGPIILHLPFCADQDQLREMYANVLASAMSKQHAESVHPAFVQVIQQLSPDEALVLKCIANLDSEFLQSEQVDESGGIIDEDNGTYTSHQFQQFCETAGVASLISSDAYLDNLLRLKLIKEDLWSENSARRSPDLGFEPPSLYVTTANCRAIRLSAFGERFVNTCVRTASKRPENGA